MKKERPKRGEEETGKNRRKDRKQKKWLKKKDQKLMLKLKHWLAF